MTEVRSMTTSVEVPVAPETAFAVFTEEIHCWWVQGPINFHDSTRAHEMRIEPGVGGRVLEVYDVETGDGLETGRITRWEPGTGLSWLSSIDDVTIDVDFEQTAEGTIVRVTATLPADGRDAGTTSWLRVTPAWLPMWLGKRDRVPHEPRRMSRLAVAVYYEKPAAAARWLRDVFQLSPAADVPAAEGDPESTWIEFHVGDASVMLFGRGAAPRVPDAPTHAPWVFVDDVERHLDHATGGGAEIVHPIVEHGARWYQARDPEGHVWSFAQKTPRMR